MIRRSARCYLCRALFYTRRSNFRVEKNSRKTRTPVVTGDVKFYELPPTGGRSARKFRKIPPLRPGAQRYSRSVRDGGDIPSVRDSLDFQRATVCGPIDRCRAQAAVTGEHGGVAGPARPGGGTPAAASPARRRRYHRSSGRRSVAVCPANRSVCRTTRAIDRRTEYSRIHHPYTSIPRHVRFSSGRTHKSCVRFPFAFVSLANCTRTMTVVSHDGLLLSARAAVASALLLLLLLFVPSGTTAAAALRQDTVAADEDLMKASPLTVAQCRAGCLHKVHFR